MNFLSALAKWMPPTFVSSFFGLALYCKWHFCVIVGAWIEGFYGLSLFGNGLMVVGVWMKFVLQCHILLSMENCDQSSIWAATRPVISLCKLSTQDFFGTVGLIYYRWRRKTWPKDFSSFWLLFSYALFVTVIFIPYKLFPFCNMIFWEFV